MKKQEEQKVVYELDDFQHHCHLWNILSGGSGKGIVLLRKIVDSIQTDNYSNPGNKLPSFLLVGKANTGKQLVAKAICNSLMCEGVREAPAQYMDSGISSAQFFQDSLTSTAHVITDMDLLSKTSESIIWRYLKEGKCCHYNFISKKYDLIQYCNGLIVMTTRSSDKISRLVLDATDYIVELEPYSSEQLEIIVHQIVSGFCKKEYSGEEILKAIVEIGNSNIGQVIEFLKICLVLLKAGKQECLNMEIVEKAKRLSRSAVPAPPSIGDGIPF